VEIIARDGNYQTSQPKFPQTLEYILSYHNQNNLINSKNVFNFLNDNGSQQDPKQNTAQHQ